jgi:hypothetical protein
MRKPSPAMIVALLGLFVALGGAGMAATGGNFILGQSNSADKTTALSAPVASGKALQVSNTSTTSGATALGLGVAPGHAPFTVNSGTKVANLNVDQLDNRDSTYFLPKTGKAADSDKLDGIDSTGFVGSSVVRRFNIERNPPAGQELLFTVGQLKFWGTCFHDINSGNAVDFFFSSSATHAAYAEFDVDNSGKPEALWNGDMQAEGAAFYELAGRSAGFSDKIILPATGTIVTADNHVVSYNVFATQNAGAVTDGSCKFGGTLVVN